MGRIDPSQISRAIQHVKAKGVRFLKVEFEALVEPRGKFQGAEGRLCRAKNCKNGKIYTCPTCNGKGEVRDDECPDCCGSGETDEPVECEKCEGYGRVLSRSEGRQLAYTEEFGNRFRHRLTEELHGRSLGFQDIVDYAECYPDQSVGTELTLTIPVDRVELLELLVSTFRDTCRSIGTDPASNDDSVARAGMHMCFLWSEVYDSSGRGMPKLPTESLTQFLGNTRKLIHALIYLGSVGEATRSLDYRYLEKEDRIKDHFGTCIEFRTFDPCYKDPPRILEDFLYMARLLDDFFTPTPAQPVKLKEFLFLEAYNLDNPLDYWGWKPLEEVFFTPAVRARLLQELDYFAQGPFATERARRAPGIVAGWPAPGP